MKNQKKLTLSLILLAAALESAAFAEGDKEDKRILKDRASQANEILSMVQAINDRGNSQEKTNGVGIKLDFNAKLGFLSGVSVTDMDLQMNRLARKWGVKIERTGVASGLIKKTIPYTVRGNQEGIQGFVSDVTSMSVE